MRNPWPLMSVVASSLGVVLISASAIAHRPARGERMAEGLQALGAIGGHWESDTVGGTSAVSDCAWTPQRGAVICEQTITSPAGVRRALDLYTFDSTAHKFAFYVLGKPGDAMQPSDLAIDGKIWTYGGRVRAPNGKYNRTINDFSAIKSYTWRAESSRDGEHWTVVAHGRSMRIARPI